MKKKIKVAYLNVNYNKLLSINEISDELETYYNLLECDTIDIAKIRVNGKWFNFVVDDFGLYKENQKISAINTFGTEQLVGNIIIAGLETFEGDLVSLTDEEIEIISNAIKDVSIDNKIQKVLIFD